jgi:hypothetical protein
MLYKPPDKFIIALRDHMTTQVNDDLYIVSMDHSPSEQLTGDNWHTTALILSSSLEHAQLANRLKFRLRKLTKWNKGSRAYRRSFLPFFLEELRKFPSVYVFAISAQESVIRTSSNHFINELGLEHYYQKIETPDKTTKVMLGPLINTSTGDEVTITLSENRALLCLFIAHFVLRMKQRMYEAVNNSADKRRGHINWNFYGDKFPGPAESDMAQMFQALTSFDRNTGRILWGYFSDSDTFETDLMVDNLAGALNTAITRAYEPVFVSGNAGTTGFFYWEKWT